MQREFQDVKERIPWLMAAGRAVLGPVMILGQRAQWSGLTLAAMVVAALLSDIFDGVLARRWKCDTAAVRRFDSMADIVFYAGCAIALWLQYPATLCSLAEPIALVIALEALCLGVSLIKFGKLPSYHSYLAKTWGLVLAPTLVAAFATKPNPRWILAALGFGALSNLEGIAMSLIMPMWRQDVKTPWHAYQVRKQIRVSGNAAQRLPSAREHGLFARLLGARSMVVLLGLGLIGAAAHAAAIPSVTFIGGSAPGIVTGTEGSMDPGADAITFRWTGGSLAIPYTQIRNFSYRETKVHLGVLPTIVLVLVHPQIYRHILSVSYLDEAAKKQVAIFEVPKQARDTLPLVLQERSGVCSDQYELPCRSTVAREPRRPITGSEIVEIPMRKAPESK